MGIWFDKRALGSNANAAADARVSGAMRRNRDEEDNRSFHLRKLLWGSPKSEHRRVSPLPVARSLARSAAQKLPTLLNHHFLKPQLPFSVRRRCAETERRRRPGGDMVWVKKPPHRKRRFVCRVKKVLSFQAVAEAKAYLMKDTSFVGRTWPVHRATLWFECNAPSFSSLLRSHRFFGPRGGGDPLYK